MQVGGLNSSFVRVNTTQEQPKTATANTSESKDTANSKPQEELSSSEKAQIAKLQSRDAAVRRHEAAHLAAGGGVVKSGANFSYQKGPDNKLYAIGGEVAIDTGKEANPEETIAKMQVVRAAALAPADPSSTDYQVASSATMMEMRARMELAQELRKETMQDSTAYGEDSLEQTEEKEALSLYA